jgi:hypothetical protein
VSEKLIMGSPADMAAWVKKAREEWQEASRPARPLQVRTCTGFGRRVA